MLSRLQMIANMTKRITELQDALELAEEAVLAGIGCEMGQGFLLSQALPQEAFEARFLRGPGIP